MYRKFLQKSDDRKLQMNLLSVMAQVGFSEVSKGQVRYEYVEK